VSGSRDDRHRALREALREIAEEDLAQVIEDARAGARAQATEIVQAALVEAIVERASAAGATPAPRTASPAPRTASPGDTGWWVYGVMASADVAALPRGVEGVEPSTEVECVEHGDLAALVSPVSLAEYGDERLREHLNDLAWVERTARIHEAALDAALEQATVVPSRLCTIYRDRDGVEEMLIADRAQLVEAVERLRGRLEWGLKVFASRSRLADAMRTEEEAGDSGSSDAALYLQRKRDERALDERVDRVATACARECHARLSVVAASARVNPPQRREAHGREAEMVLNGVYLVADAERAALRAAVDELRNEYEPLGFELEPTGPWPPYNFVASEAASEL
jgi:hypothetical protein